MAERSSPERLAVAIDPLTNVSLADYTFLPTALQQRFQATLEGDQGIALLHFAGEVELLEGRAVSHKVLLVSTEALYVCTPQADVIRSTALRNVDGILVCDEWVCLVIPSEYDLCFRFTPRNERRCVNVEFFLGILNGLFRHLNLSTLTPRVVTSHHTLTQRPTSAPPNFREKVPTPIPLLAYASFDGVRNAHVLYDALLPHHAARCSEGFKRPYLVVGPSTPTSPGRGREPGADERVQPGPSSPAQSAERAAAETQWSPPRHAAAQHRRHSPSPGRQSHHRDLRHTTSGGSGAGRRLHTATSGGERGCPPKDASELRRFEDPCLELVWAELMNQRDQLRLLSASVEKLLEDRYPAQVRYHHREQQQQHSPSAARRNEAGNGGTGSPGEKMHDGFHELSAFQRKLYELDAGPHHSHHNPPPPPPPQRRTPEHPNPQYPLFVRTKKDTGHHGQSSPGTAAANSASPPGAASGPQRRTLRTHELMGYGDGKHHLASTATSRNSAILSSPKRRGGGAAEVPGARPTARAPNTGTHRWLSPTSSSQLRNKR